MGVNNRMALPTREEAAGQVSLSACLTYGKGIDEFYVFGAEKITQTKNMYIYIYIHHNTLIYIVLVPWWVKLSQVYTADHLENQQDCKTSIKIIVGRGQ